MTALGVAGYKSMLSHMLASFLCLNFPIYRNRDRQTVIPVWKGYSAIQCIRKWSNAGADAEEKHFSLGTGQG